MSAIGHFGKGINTRVFDVSLRDHEGKPRHCLGKGVHDGSIKWYSYSSIDANRLSFCEHCAKSGLQGLSVCCRLSSSCVKSWK